MDGMDARQWVLGALDALRLELPNLAAERRRALRSELVALVDTLDRCNTPDDWERLRRDLQSFGTRHGMRRVLDAGALSGEEALPVSRGVPDRGPGHGASPQGRAPSELSAFLRRLLGKHRPAPIETYPEVDAPEEVVERTAFRIEVTARWQPTALAGGKAVLPRAGEGPVDLEVQVELAGDGALPAACQLVQPLRVPEALDSTTLGFELFAERSGPARIIVCFRQ